ncbi:MAG TPA: RNA polymerase sigma factor [Candidatus Krumholzibacteria bacterium]|nr:RNA polymerase sigma factor [Candidatus Krumholzibacteria bacterium]
MAPWPFFRRVPANKPDDGGYVPAATDGGPAADPDQEQRRRDRADIERALGGDPRGFEDLMNRYRQRAYAVALGLAGSHDDAMDAVQKAFIRIHRTLDRFQVDRPFFPWLYRIVRNAALNQRRDEKRHQGDVPLEWVRRPDGRPDPLAEREADDLRERLWTGIQELPPEMREVFLLYHFQGLKYREIAAACGIPIGTVMSRLHAARRRLQQAAGLEDAS